MFLSSYWFKTFLEERIGTLYLPSKRFKEILPVCQDRMLTYQFYLCHELIHKTIIFIAAFGLGTMIYNGLEFGAFFEVPFTSPCYMILRGVNPVLQMVFTFMQMYFIFMNSRVSTYISNPSSTLIVLSLPFIQSVFNRFLKNCYFTWQR